MECVEDCSMCSVDIWYEWTNSFLTSKAVPVLLENGALHISLFVYGGRTTGDLSGDSSGSSKVSDSFACSSFSPNMIRSSCRITWSVSEILMITAAVSSHLSAVSDMGLAFQCMSWAVLISLPSNYTRTYHGIQIDSLELFSTIV